ncbi:hypothetical protein B0H14DRAFT_3569389 [Mycena olivaceomarginata]|nr:hypothetical protein B0H14DRAFT_3569389 [Mycena olivaceomarginata]
MAMATPLASTPRVNIPTYISLGTSDAANSQIWAIYLAEAQKYDKVLVESWRDNVNGILIFAGLFSATVTGFIIDGYKTLLPDSGATTVDLLKQISSQLSEISQGNSGTITVSPPPQFVPSKSALACNILWFTSLGLSLSCALVATLVAQWAQDFLHRTEMRSAPVIGARIMSYLYYGMQHFNMHTMVAAIPLLLHASLFFFFAGLVAFLIPVNFAIMAVCSVILLIFTVVYATLTFLPLYYLDCPYRTPLSGVLWCFGAIANEWYHRIMRSLFYCTADSSDISAHKRSTVDAMTHEATADSDTRASRDYRALRWTVKSLIDDEQLQPFVHCIPGLLQDEHPAKRSSARNRYKEHITALIRDRDIQLYVRIEGMLRSARLAGPEYQVAGPAARSAKQRQYICFRAIWAIAQMDIRSPVITDSALIQAAYKSEADSGYVQQYMLPLVTFARYRAFTALGAELDQVHRYLAECRTHSRASGRTFDVALVLPCIKKLQACSEEFHFSDRDAFGNLLQSYPTVGTPASMTSLWIDGILAVIKRVRTEIPYLMLFHYLTCAAQLNAEPLEHKYTLSLFQLPKGPLEHVVKNALESAYRHVTGRFPGPTGNFVDNIVSELATFWPANRRMPARY